MTEFNGNKGDLHATALNDIEACIRDMFSDPPDEEAYRNLTISIRNAINLGVSPESALSKLLNSIPEPVRDSVVRGAARKHHLTDDEVEAITAPED
jgi:hypothetical protein